MPRIPPPVAFRQRDRLTDWAMVGVCALALRDTFAGALRWLLATYNLTLLWYVVDVLAAVGLVIFVSRIAVRERSAPAVFMIFVFVIGMIAAAAFVSAEPLYLVSAAKMLLPLFLGWSFAGTDVTRNRSLTRFMIFVAVIGMIGIYLSTLIEFPWASLKVETFGVTRTAGETRFIRDEQRYTGFAGQNSLAGMMAILPLIFVHRRLGTSALALLCVAAMAACLITTSRTAQGALAIFMIWVLLERHVATGLRSVHSHRVMAFGSFALALSPVFLIGLAGDYDFASVSRSLTSFQERVQLSWQYPFKYWWDTQPVASFFGCGLGCFASPMMYSKIFYVMKAVDNFYLLTVVMFGVFAVIPIGIMFYSSLITVNRTKLLMFVIFNAAASVIDGYTTAFLCFFAGYATSETFVNVRTRRAEPRVKPA